MFQNRKLFLVIVSSLLLVPYFLQIFSYESLPTNIILNRSDSNDSSIVYLFVHGLGANSHESKRYKNIMCKSTFAAFNFPDAKKKANDYHRIKVNLGQDEDIDCLKKAYQEVEAACPGCSIVLVGVSRGAATIINFAAQQQPKNLKALVLDSPFDTYESVVNHLADRHYLGWIPGCKTVGKKLFCTRFPKFDPHGVLPINQIEKMPNIPIIFVHTTDDELIPHTSSQNLYEKIKDRGNVHLIVINGAEHARIIVDPKTKDTVENVIHAFYKKYNLPYDAQKAAMDTLLK